MKKAFYYQTPLGEIGLAENGRALTNVFFGNSVRPKEFVLEETPLLRRGAMELAEYFAKERQTFDLPLELEGTPFEQQVWQTLLKIPYGQTWSYGQLAKAIGRPTASRAVGRANGRNPLSIFVPCHRVIGASGSLTGYAGGLEAKIFLLRLEGAQGNWEHKNAQE